jgi:equilibrative nucleoside transporter 1/2/3
MTIAVVPPLTVLVVPEHPNTSLLSGRFVIPVTNFLMVGISDFVGRYISSHVPLPLDRPKLLFLLSIGRWIAVPLLMLCNAHPRQYLPVVFKSDVFFVFLITIVGLTNGYLYINAMMNGPMFVAPGLRTKAGFVLVLFLGIGVALGSLTSNIVLRLL